MIFLRIVEKKCPGCGRVDKFTEREVKALHFCQNCYHKYKALEEAE